MEALNYLLKYPPLNNADATGDHFSNLRAVTSGAKCFGRTVTQIAASTAKLTYNLVKLSFEGIGAGLGAAAGFLGGAGRKLADKTGLTEKPSNKTLSDYTIKGLRTGAKYGEVPGFLLGVPVVCATTVLTSPVNLLFSAIQGLNAGIEVKNKGSSFDGDQNFNQKILKLNQCLDNDFLRAHTALHGKKESSLDAFFKGLRESSPESTPNTVSA